MERSSEQNEVDDVSGWNESIIEEFRANGGEVGGHFDGATLLILHTTGAKSGAERLAPLMYRREGERIFVFASRAGADVHPDWYFNLKADPEVRVEIGPDEVAMEAVEITGPERDAIYDRHATAVPQFGVYQDGTDRIIPVIELIRRD